MEQHPVPQNVTTFQFRLIGDMTIKQFGYLCAGAILGFIFFKLPLPILITWPLAGTFVFLGIGFAFVPIEERPMDVWVFSFFKSIYSPTQYIWKQEPIVPKSTTTPQTTNAALQKPKPTPQQSVTPIVPKQIVTQQQASVVPHSPTLSDAARSWFGAKNPPTPNIQVPSVTGYHLDEPSQPNPANSPPPQQPSQESKIDQEKIAMMEASLKILQEQLAAHTMTQERVVELQKQLTDVLAQKASLENELVSLRRQIGTSPTNQASPPQSHPPHEPTVKIISGADAVKVGLPRLTNLPNVITGIIKDDVNNFLPGILVTIINAQKIPMRAFKTNKLGQFGATTPLPNGIYIIEVEDPRARFVFDRAQITLNGAVVPALEIIAKGQKQIVREKLTQEIFGGQHM
jgi:hypothetical protein